MPDYQRISSCSSSCTTFLVRVAWAWLGREIPTKPLVLTLSEPGTQTRHQIRCPMTAPGLDLEQMASAFAEVIPPHPLTRLEPGGEWCIP